MTCRLNLSALGGLDWWVGPIPITAPWPWARIAIDEEGVTVGPSNALAALTTLGLIEI